MHSKIFQVSKAPIDRKITEDDILDRTSFVGPIANYVSDMDPEAEEYAIQWLSEAPGIQIDGDKLTVYDKKDYFATSYQHYLQLLREAESKTMDEFAQPMMGWFLYEFRMSVRDEFGFYMADNSNGYVDLIPLADFMRNAADGEVYHLGSVLDYRY